MIIFPSTWKGLKEIAYIRQDAMSAIYSRFLKDRKVLTSKHLEKVKGCLQDEDSKVQAFATRIGRLLDDQEIKNVKALFEACLCQMEKMADLEYSMDYIYQQSKDPQRCPELFTDPVIRRLSDILRSSDYDYLTKNYCNEIINNYLEHSFTRGLELEALEKVCSILEVRILSHDEETKLELNKLKEKALISVLLTAEKDNNLPNEIIAFLVEKMESLNGNLVNFIIIILGKICNQADLTVHYQEQISRKLLDKLEDDKVIIDNGAEMTFGPREESNLPNPAISEITARILFSFLKNGKRASSVIVNKLAKALDSSDKQTRIQTAKAISFASKNNMGDFDRDILLTLEGFLTDKVPDVAIYSINVYTKIFSELPETEVESRHLDILAAIYAYEELRLSAEEEFSGVVNKNILTVFATQANKQLFFENIFNVFEYIFLSDDQNKEEALDIVNSYVNEKQEIPASTILAIENVLGNSELSEKSLVVLEKVIRNGQRVSDKTLKILADNLFSDDTEEEIKNRNLTTLLQRFKFISTEIFQKDKI